MIISKVATKDVPITVRSFLPFFACAPFLPLTILSGLVQTWLSLSLFLKHFLKSGLRRSVQKRRTITKTSPTVGAR
jgi:hypothetical protein